MMENKDFIIRPLEEKDYKEFNDLLRYAFQITSKELTNTGWDNDEIRQSKRPVIRDSFVLGCFYKSSLASQIVVYPMEVNIFDKIYDMAGITGVATYPEYAGKGIIHNLMTKCFQQIRKQKQTIAFLYPYSIPFYRKMGFEIVSDLVKFSLKDTQLPRHRQVKGMVKRVSYLDQDIKNVYDYFSKQRHGALVRDKIAWEEYWRWETEDLLAAIYYDENNKPLGFILYYLQDFILRIKEMVYLNSEAKQGLWNFLTAHYSMVNEVKGNNYSGEPFAFLIDDSEIEEIIRPYMMARIVDFERFILDYPFEVSNFQSKLTFKINDKMAPWNDGYFELDFKDEELVSVKKLDYASDINLVELEISTLTTMLLGYKRPEFLYENGLLKMEYYLVKVLEKLIPNEKPYFSDYF